MRRLLTGPELRILSYLEEVMRLFQELPDVETEEVVGFEDGVRELSDGVLRRSNPKE